MYSNPLLEGQVVEMQLHFKHLYGDKWAAFYGKATRWRVRRIIFPQFSPEEGVKYSVRVMVTKTGEFTYEGEIFRVCRAELTEAATRGEVLVHKILGGVPETTIGLALRQGVGTSKNTTLADKLADALGKK